MVVRRAIAEVVPLALLQASDTAFACSINCSRASSTKHVDGGTQQSAVHQHSHQGHTAAYTCCPNTPQVNRSSCSSHVQPSARHAGYRVNPDSLTAAQSPFSRAAHSERPSPKCSSASPLNFFIRPALTTLRI